MFSTCVRRRGGPLSNGRFARQAADPSQIIMSTPDLQCRLCDRRTPTRSADRRRLLREPGSRQLRLVRGGAWRSALRHEGRIRCELCGAATTHPWPTDAELVDAYARYRPQSGRFSGVGDALLRRTRARLASRVDRLAPPGPVLDVGSGDGTLLDALRVRGRTALGLERDSKRDDVREVEITELDQNWSAIIFWHALEHLPAPGAAIDHACAHLSAGGVLLVAVPDAASLQAIVFGDRWFHLDLPRHLVHLPATALWSACALWASRSRA